MKHAGPLVALAVIALLGGALAYQRINLRQDDQVQVNQGTGHVAAADAPAASTQAAVPGAVPDLKKPGAAALPALDLGTTSEFPRAGTASTIRQRPWPSQLEKTLVQGNGVDGATSLQLLKSKDFQGYLAQLSRDADADALKRSKEYREVLEESLAEISKGSKLDQIACGQDFCIANVQSQSGSEFGPWYRNIQSASPIPLQVMMAEKVPNPNGSADYRLFFTTNKSVNTVRMPPGPQTTPGAR